MIDGWLGRRCPSTMSQHHRPVSHLLHPASGRNVARPTTVVVFGRTQAGQFAVEVFAVDDAMVLTLQDRAVTHANAIAVRGALEEEIIEKVDCGVRHVVIDLTGVSEIDHAGVSALFALDELVKRKGARLALCGLQAEIDSPNLRRVMAALAMAATPQAALQQCRK